MIIYKWFTVGFLNIASLILCIEKYNEGKIGIVVALVVLNLIISSLAWVLQMRDNRLTKEELEIDNKLKLVCEFDEFIATYLGREFIGVNAITGEDELLRLIYYEDCYYLLSNNIHLENDFPDVQDIIGTKYTRCFYVYSSYYFIEVKDAYTEFRFKSQVLTRI